MPTELTDDVRSRDPLWGNPGPRELTALETIDVHNAFLDSDGMDLLSELSDLGNLGSARGVMNVMKAMEFVQRWQAKLVDAEAQALARN